MRDMSEREMIELMDMDDEAPIFMLSADSFEWRDGDDANSFAWDVQARYGGDYDKALFKTEGAAASSNTDARVEMHWDHVIGRWWRSQLGIRHDIHEGPARTWAAFGIQGLAPYWFDIEATAYVGEEGSTALRLAIDYQLRLTQRLILEPELELNAYGQRDPENAIGAGLSDTEIALRLRFEIHRELAPYIGVAWTRLHGDTADMAKDASDLEWLVGVRWWF
jgi:copper resistance protein B